MKQAKMQWLHNPNQSNVDNLNNVRRGASRYFRGGEEYVPEKWGLAINLEKTKYVCIGEGQETLKFDGA
jgi:hypothetical protein